MSKPSLMTLSSPSSHAATAALLNVITIWIQELAQVGLVFERPLCTIRPTQQHEEEVRVRQSTKHDIV